MTTRFTIGIEEEFQTVDRSTGCLSAQIQQILEAGYPIFGEQIKAEMLQPTVELISGIFPDIPSARHALQLARAKLGTPTEQGGAGTNQRGNTPRRTLAGSGQVAIQTLCAVGGRVPGYRRE